MIAEMMSLDQSPRGMVMDKCPPLEFECYDGPVVIILVLLHLL